MQVLFNPRSKVYLRTNPNDDCEIQWASHPNNSWQKYYKFSSPVMALALDEERNCVVAILENHRTYMATNGSFNPVSYPSGHRLRVMYGF